MLRNRLDDASRLLWLKAGWILVLGLSTGFVADTCYRFFLLGEEVSPFVLEGLSLLILVAAASVFQLSRLERVTDEVAAALEFLAKAGQNKPAGRPASRAPAPGLVSDSPPETAGGGRSDQVTATSPGPHGVTALPSNLGSSFRLAGAVSAPVASRLPATTREMTKADVSNTGLVVTEDESLHFDLEAVVFGACAVVAPKAGGEGIEILVDLDPDVPTPLVGDPIGLGQVLSSLLERAVDASPPGEIVLQGRVRTREPERVVVQFCLDGMVPPGRPQPDNGVFSGQNGRGDSLAASAIGEGLASEICLGLAARLGAKIGIQEGADGRAWLTFDVSLGVVAQSTPHAASYAARLKAFAGRRVMVIDGSAGSRHVLGALLSQLGFAPDLFESGELALARLLSACSPNYLFCCIDRSLHGRDGLQVVQRLRAYYGSSCPPLLMLGGPAKGAELHGGGRGIIGVLSKPCGLEKLFHFVASILPVPAADNVSESYRAERSHAARLRGKRIILAEIPGVARDLMADCLRQADLVVSLASDGLAVLQAVREERPDGIVIACRLPGMDGFEAAHRLRHAGCPLPIIALGAAGDREGCLAAGMSDLIGKPVQGSVLFAVLAQWLAPSRLNPRSMPARPELPVPAAGSDSLPPLPPGLDVESGLRRLQGKKALFLKALRMFRDSRGHQFQFEFRTAIAAQDWQTSERLAHSLKDTAATIGANEVSAAAASLESAIRERHYKDVQSLLADVTDKLRAIVDGLAHIR